MLADRVPSLPAVLRPVEQDVGDVAALLAPRAENPDLRVPYDVVGRQLLDRSLGDVDPLSLDRPFSLSSKRLASAANQTLASMSRARQ